MRRSQSTARALRPQPSHTLQQLQQLRAELRSHLMRDPEYRALVAVERAITEIGTKLPQVESASPSKSSKRLAVPAHGAASSVSQSVATAQILEEHAVPMRSEELIPKLKARGVRFRAKEPRLSLSATLSSNKQFRSVKYQGQRCWWFSDRSIPGDVRLKAGRVSLGS